MKSWKCSVCGYVHEGDTPPKKCPLCGVSSEKFVLEGGEETPSTTDIKWKCSVCGYIHTGATPPEKCPLCGVAADKFVQEGGVEGKGLKVKQKKSAVVAPPSFLVRQLLRFHMHPISVHFPNGILPASLLFFLLALFFQMPIFEEIGFYNAIFVAITMPLVLYTGYVEWQHTYRGARTMLFRVKIAAAVVVFVTLLALIIWRILVPGILAASSPYRFWFLLLAAVMVGAAGVAGHLGSKLVYKK